MSNMINRKRDLKKLFPLNSTAKESNRKSNNKQCSSGGWEPTSSKSGDDCPPAPSLSREIPASTNSNANSPSRGGSARRHYVEEHKWLKRALKLHAARYISNALEHGQMTRAELAHELGTSKGRVDQLISIRGFGEYERVPLDLIYQIQLITGYRFEMPTKKLVPPANLTKEHRADQ